MIEGLCLSPKDFMMYHSTFQCGALFDLKREKSRGSWQECCCKEGVDLMEFGEKKGFEESPCDIPLTWCQQSERHSQRFLLPFWSFAILWKLRSLVILRDPLYRKLDESFESPRCFNNWWKFYGIQGNSMLKVLTNQLRTFQYPMLPEKCPTLPLSWLATKQFLATKEFVASRFCLTLPTIKQGSIPW